MIHKIFSVYDDKADAFLPPFYQHTEAMAKRVFSDACRETAHPFNKNPDDYCLYNLGAWDDGTGYISTSKEPTKMLEATEVLDLYYAALVGKPNPDTPLSPTPLEEIINGK